MARTIKAKDCTLDGSVRVRAGKYNLRGRIDGQSVQAASRMAVTVAV